jgi:hypothetical protein
MALLPSPCCGWGRDGHHIIASFAEDHLDETTEVMIQSLIGNNHLYSIASWADDIRNERRETAPWHYVNIPLGSVRGGTAFQYRSPDQNANSVKIFLTTSGSALRSAEPYLT